MGVPGMSGKFVSDIQKLNQLQKAMGNIKPDASKTEDYKSMQKSIFDTVAKKQEVLEKYQAFLAEQNNKAPEQQRSIPQNMWDMSNSDASDAKFAYSNANANGAGNFAPEVYAAQTSITAEVKENGAKNAFIDTTAGIVETKGDNVSTAQTFASWLLNDNQDSTAFIGNTTAEQLADNMFDSMDSIKDVDSENLEKTEDGKSYVLRNDSNPEKSFTVNGDLLKDNIKAKDGIVNSSEYGLFARAVASDASIASAKGEIGEAQGSENKRISSASTVKINAKTDPYYQFMRAAGSADGVSGISREELREAIKEIGTNQGDGLSFDKAKLNEYLQKRNKPDTPLA